MSRSARRNRAHLITGGITGGITCGITCGIAGSLALMMVGAGGAIAAARIGSAQIADNTVRSRDVRDGSLLLRDLEPGAQAGLRGPAGPQGPTGELGPAGSDGVAQVTAVAGPVASILGSSGGYVFAGPPVQVTTTATHARVTGSVAASLGLNTGSPQFADVGMCHQPSAGGALTDFAGTNFATYYFTTSRATYAAAATKVLPPAAYNVGMCIRNNGSNPINNNNLVTGWVMVTS